MTTSFLSHPNKEVSLGENSIECSDCPADTDPLTCASISCVPGCDGKCTDLGYCSCDMHHHGDRCQQGTQVYIFLKNFKEFKLI